VMAGDEREIQAKKTGGDATAAADSGASVVTPDTCGLQLECPVCGWKAEGVRCVRCGALKAAGCSGSCGGCGGCASKD